MHLLCSQLKQKCTEMDHLCSFLHTFHTQVATYTGGSQLEWRVVKSGNLPSSRKDLRAAVVDNVIYVTGGENGDFDELTSILAWDLSTESWQHVGDLSVKRDQHAAVAIPYSMIESSGCSTILLSARIICSSLLFHTLFVNDFFRL